MPSDEEAPSTEVPGVGSGYDPEASEDHRPLRIAVVGGGDADPGDLEAAREVGALLARAGAAVISGGRGGVMEAVSRGCAAAGGWTVGILPGRDPGDANPWVRMPLATGMGQGRNVLVVRAGEAVLAVGGGWGTLSEIALARKLGRSVALLGDGSVAGVEDLGLPVFSAASDAVAWALEHARNLREEGRRGAD